MSPRLESFCWRIENALLREGGFALIHGEPGSGKSVALRVIAQRLARLPDVQLGTISHPQCNLADFYRELGDVFGVPLRRGAASRRCASVGSAICSRVGAARCCSSTRRRR